MYVEISKISCDFDYLEIFSVIFLIEEYSPRAYFSTVSETKTLIHRYECFERSTLSLFSFLLPISNCCVDKAISELEIELKKISPTGSKLTCAQLAMATVLLNNKIRNRGLSASEIHFSRDSHSSENLNIDDNQLREDSIKLREVNHGQSARSKAPKGKPHVQ